ncbi:hypothetical protein BS17DRAFT_769402 [Gyrodon lividus]|nr:hypothetical protein BS17DRAFT_769402 [Gyrodon lividus]
MESNALVKKVRLMHIVFEGILIVELPRSAHKVPLSKLRGALALLIEQMPYDNVLVHPLVEMNLLLKLSSGDFSATPDLSICLAHLSGRWLRPKFLYEDAKWLGPITVADHTWCHISNIDYHVWVKGGEEKINIGTQSSGMTVAYSTLFLKIDMDTVDIVIHQGLLKIRDGMIQLSKRLDPETDMSLLSATDILWDFNWSQCQVRIANAAECMAHKWFEDWYSGCFGEPNTPLKTLTPLVTMTPLLHLGPQALHRHHSLQRPHLSLALGVAWPKGGH